MNCKYGILCAYNMPVKYTWDVGSYLQFIFLQVAYGMFWKLRN